MLNDIFIDGYKITKCNRLCSWFQMICSFMALTINILLLINNANICNNSKDINEIQYCVSTLSNTNLIIIINMMIQPIVFMNGYNTLRLKCCSSKRIQYIEHKIDTMYNDSIID
tara:strand:- start:1 stop:342 length:342 start_codon:yes stop_codon:yes gene_type:complete